MNYTGPVGRGQNIETKENLPFLLPLRATGEGDSTQLSHAPTESEHLVASPLEVRWVCLCPFFWSGPTSADTCCGPEAETFVGWVRPGVSVFKMVIHMLKETEIVMRGWINGLLDRSSEGCQELLQARRWGQVRADVLSSVTPSERGSINSFITN